MQPKFIFFNSSMPRSCSTLLQNILSQNNSIYATPTDPSLEYLYAARRNYTEIPEVKAQNPDIALKAWRGFCWGGLTGYCDALTEKPNVCIKSRGIGVHYDWYSAFMPNPPKIVCMVRNIKGIFASMEKIYRANQERHQNVQNHGEMRGTTTAKRVDEWLASPPIGLALERFQQMILEGIDKKVLFVRAEDLTSTPKTEMKKIYEYLNLPGFTHDFANIAQTTIEDDAIYGLTPDLHKIRSVVEPLVDNSARILGKDTCRWLDANIEFYQSYFGY
ncbi:MAG: sulfotransferase [Sulfurimonas sp.]|jgi:sulfotransferase